ncbi:hypothetical protein BH11CYA1_BH11CYA1_26170 [soil metagenome]
MSVERDQNKHLDHNKHSDHKNHPEASKVEGHAEKSSLHLLNAHGASNKHQDTKKLDNSKDSPAQKHLPTLEIVDHKKLQDKLVDKSNKHKPEDRLHAAHKLYASNHKLFSTDDKHGKVHHYQIVEKRNEKDHSTKVALFELDGKNIRLALDGTMNDKGNFENVKEHSSEPKQFKRNKAEKADSDDDGQQVHTKHKRHRHSAGRSHRDHLASYHSTPNSTSDSTQDSTSARDGFESPGKFSSMRNLPSSEYLPSGGNLPSDKLIKLDNGMIYLRSKLAVDTDGGSDWQSDRYGQATTSLTNRDGSSLDANRTNYFVLPMTYEYKKLGIELGDLAWVRNARTGKMVAAIFGDHGPRSKIGEGSQALCRALGLSGDPNSGGTDKKEIEFFIQPNSGNGKGDIAKRESQMVAKLEPLEKAPARHLGGSISDKIVACAQAAEGDQLWLNHAGATQNGRLGCAISTSEVLSQAGLDIKKETGAFALANQLQGRGWNRIAVSQASPGDVIYGVKPGTVQGSGGGNAHIGIVGERENGKLMVFANVSKTGRWTHETASRGFSPNRFGDQIWAFTPPQSAQA